MRFMKAISRTLGCFFLCGILGSSGAAFGQGESKKDCGPGRRPGIKGCVDAIPRARATPGAIKPSNDAKPPTPDASMRPPPDERTPAEAAERVLLLRELQQLEALLKATPTNAPERAALLKRVADTYADLAKRAEHDREIARVRAERARRDNADRKVPRRTRAPTHM
jgi:hypothetical protein